MSYHFDLNESVHRKLFDGKSRAGREGGGKFFAIHTVHLTEQAHVGNENCSFDDIVECKSLFSKDSFDVSKRLACLCIDTRRHFAIGRVNW